MDSFIEIKGAKENNLKNISVCIPKNKLVVLTGLSGSGKSTLALDTLQKECQRQYMESMGMITDFISKPNVNSIIGLSPSISIDQRNNNRNPRSTVGTVTEVFTYLRVLYAKLGIRECPYCGGQIHQRFDTGIETDSVIVQDDNPTDGISNTNIYENQIPCPHCGKKLPELTMAHFSFNKPEGACPKCKGLGVVNSPNLARIMNVELSIRDGAITFWDKFYIDRYSEAIDNAAKHYGFSISSDKPLKYFDQVGMDFLLYGALGGQFCRHFPDIKPPKTVPSGRFEGIITNLERRFSEAGNGTNKKLSLMFHQAICPECNGVRLRKESIGVTVGGINIIELSKKSLEDVSLWIGQIHSFVTPEALAIAKPVIDDLEQRIRRLLDVGVGYLNMERTAITLSAGEAQRLRLASLLGSGLTGVLYVLDEPTTGLHARDTGRLLSVLKKLRDLGNTVLVIEHDIEVMRDADHIIDFGPGAGKNGGEIVVIGSPDEVAACEHSLTGRHLSGIDKIVIPSKKRAGNKKHISIYEANTHNLKNINVSFPLGMLITLTGVSGSGKSTLLFDVLGREAEIHFGHSQTIPEKINIKGLENVSDIITIDQSAIGRTSRSNAATYTDIFTYIRDLYSSLEAAKKRKLQAKHFSFNVPGGRCEKCEGNGELSISMHFLPDVLVKCPVCHGKRFQKQILEVKYKGFSISDVLQMTITDAVKVFCDVQPILDRLSVLEKVGLGYLSLGQSATTLSGGEAQRIKLAKELGKRTGGHTLYLLDEPTTGLHPHDVKKLIALLNELVDQGNTVITVEHNLDVIAISDWIIDFGPEGGNAGGEIIVQGTPEVVAEDIRSKTGVFLKEMLKK
ncbi:MAG: excinuclease subunit [Herbinix sp.]|jgi:excinuclease ABC subunit A|nr:excinuclease subunit [Herbinix sp.]